MPKAKTAPKKIVKEKKVSKVAEISAEQEVSVEPKEVVLEKTSNVMTKKDRISDVKVTPTIVDIRSWKIHVKAKYNNGSFKAGQEYFVSQKVFQNYQGNLEIIE